jgi:hypothetical protein
MAARCKVCFKQRHHAMSMAQVSSKRRQAMDQALIKTSVDGMGRQYSCLK